METTLSMSLELSYLEVSASLRIFCSSFLFSFSISSFCSSFSVSATSHSPSTSFTASKEDTYRRTIKSYSPWLALYIHEYIHYLNQYGYIILHMIEHLPSVKLYRKTKLHWMMNERINIDGSIAGIFLFHFFLNVWMILSDICIRLVPSSNLLHIKYN